jgi:uncharacterized lipoprotein
MLRCLIAGALAASALSGCSGESTLNCETSERYAAARSVPPVRVPDDLSVPDETDSLRLPPAPAADGAGERCLETPPDFFEDRRLGAPDSAASEEEEAETEPAAASDPDRQISN